MNIEILARQAIDRIKSEYILPERGFLAGGSIANIIWEIVSGNKAVINDIDIFIFKDFISNLSDDSIFKYNEDEIKLIEVKSSTDELGRKQDIYDGISWRATNKDYYEIVESAREGMINNIYYNSNTTNPELILNSFDINSTKVGYLIEEDRFFINDDFIDFLKTGDLKITNLRTPSHTAIRICKKKHELNCNLDSFEYKLLQHCTSSQKIFIDVIKVRFMEKYHDLYNKYIDDIGDLFEVDRDLHTENYVKLNFNKDIELYYLKSKSHLINPNNFDDVNIDRIHRSSDFLFYMRNIYKNERLSKIWMNLHIFFKDTDYVDKDVSIDDIELLGRFIKYAPNSIRNLYGYKLSEQIDIINKFLSSYKEDPLIAISILEKVKVDRNIELDENTLLLLELSVRKQIVNDSDKKVDKILFNKHTQKYGNKDYTFWD